MAKKRKSIGKIIKGLASKKKSGKMARMQSLFTVQASKSRSRGKRPKLW